MDAGDIVEHLGDESYFIYATVAAGTDRGLEYHVQKVTETDFVLEPVSVAPERATYVAEGFGWVERRD